MRRSKALALCGILAALALALMFFSGVIPAASIACPVLSSLILIPVYCEYGRKWGWLWYAAVSILAVVVISNRESAILFVFLGYYPMLKKYFERLPARILKWAGKLIYINLAIFAAYGLMLYIFRVAAVMEDLGEATDVMLLVMLVLANASFVIYDLLIGRLEIFYFVRIRPKLKL